MIRRLPTQNPHGPPFNYKPSMGRFMWRLPKDSATVQSSEIYNGRNSGRAISGGSIHWLLGFVFPFCLSAHALALPPLVVAADVARPDLQAFWKDGDLLIGLPTEPGRPGRRPLQGHNPIQLPPNLEEWTAIGETCDKTPRGEGHFGGVPIQAIVAGDTMHPKVELWMHGRPVAATLLGRPATICALHVLNADSVQGPELITAWRMDSPNPIRGYTVYKIPEALDPTPIASPD